MRFSSCFSILGAVVVTTNTVLAQDSCMTIADIACTTDGFETLCNLVASAGLDDVLSDESTDLTVFAPQDAAFEALGSEVIDALINSEDDLLDVLLYHVVDESLNSTDLNCEPGENLVEMLNGKNSRTICDGDAIYQKGDGNLREDMPQIIAADIEACNGVVHVVDKVLIPPNFLGGSTPSEAPATEAPVTASPGTEAPVTASPGTEAPVTSAPGTEAPVTASPGTEAPVTSAPGTEAPVTASPGTEAPVTSAPGTEAPVTASPGTEAPDPPTAECQSIGKHLLLRCKEAYNAVTVALQLKIISICPFVQQHQPNKLVVLKVSLSYVI